MSFVNPSSWTPLANHLWQSTAFAAVIWLLTLALKKNRAAVRYWLWFAASLKFLIPFSALVALGSQLSWRTAASAAHPPRWSFVADNAIQPFAAPIAPIQSFPAHASFNFAPILIAIWLCGVAVGVAFWLKCWIQMRHIRNNAAALPIRLPIPVLSSPSQIEPGVFGILRPVLLLPAGIESRLTPTQLDAILAHEMAHVRRRDNLTAAIHMLVETIFWFFPLVWWLRARMIEERELACDEAVLGLGGEADAYAEGIIQVCKSYVESPAACISGISGADLKKRILRIVSPRPGENLTPVKKFALAVVAAIAVFIPLAIGLANAPLLRAQSSAAEWEKAAGGKMAFDVASIKRHPYDPASRGYMPHGDFSLSSDDQYAETGGLMSTENMPVTTYVRFAYKIGTHQSVQALPKWANDEHFDIQARGPANATKDQMRLMMQSLLADRFKLAVHWEDKQIPMFSVVLAKAEKAGPQLQPSAEGPCVVSPHEGPPKTPNEVSCGGQGMQYLENGEYLVIGHYRTMQEISPDLADWPGTGVDRPLMDGTGLSGMFDFKLVWAPEPPPGQEPQAPVSGSSYLDALRDQLGLKLVPTTGPWRYLVIDHIEEPSPN